MSANRAARVFAPRRAAGKIVAVTSPIAVSMVLLAAGRGTRFGGEVPKAFLALRGHTLLERSLERLAAIPVDGAREIVIATHPDDAARLEPLRARFATLGVTAVVAGGDTRQESMRNALAACSPHAHVVLVHDAARPFFPVEAARQAIALAHRDGGALLAVPAPDTLKKVDGTRVLATVPREGVWLAQTPQVARRELLLEAMARAERDGFAGTDDVSLLERIGATVHVVRSATTNLKVTTPDDWALAEAIAAREDEARA